jgi:uncharacterized protein YggE
MNRKNRILILAGVSVLLLAGTLAGSAGRAQPQAQTTPSTAGLRTVTVTGIGQVNVQPDTAVAFVGVRSEAASAQDALDQNNQATQALLDALSSEGVADEDLQTTSIQLQPRYSDTTNQTTTTRELIGYTAANVLQVRVRELDRLGELLDAAVAAGGNTIEGIQFEVSDPNEAQDQAREAAMDDARRKAEQLAGLVNSQLGDVYSISETVFSPLPFGGVAAEAPVRSSVPIATGTQAVSIQLSVTWLLEDGSLPNTGATATRPPASTATSAATRTATATRPAATATQAATQSPEATATGGMTATVTQGAATTEAPATTETPATPEAPTATGTPAP